MQNLKINGTPTPYWCVVVPVNTSDFYIDNENSSLEYLLSDNKIKYEGGHYLEDGNWELFGCITSSSMDEGVKEMVGESDYAKLYPDFENRMTGEYCFSDWQNSALSLLTHNQITLTTSTKAVVVKQKL